MDFQASHDLEGFVAIIDGRDTLLREISQSLSDLRDYLAEPAKSLLAGSRFLDVLRRFVRDRKESR